MNQPLVSIIIPVYNKATFIRETLDSALAQTYLNTEIILVDDGSTDGSLEILEHYAKDFPKKIRLFAQKNAGVSSATNKGIQMAKGDYIQFLDADDLLSPSKIENQIRRLVGHSFGVVSTCEWVTFWENPEEHERWNLGVFKDYLEPIEMGLDFFNRSEMMADSSYLVSRELIEKVGLWNETLCINQDGDFFLRIILNCSKIIFDSSSKVYYRKPGLTNVSQQKSYLASESLLESYRLAEKEMISKEDSERVRKSIAKNYIRFIYVTYPNYSNLIKKFQFVSKVFGFRNALRLKNIINFF